MLIMSSVITVAERYM